MRTLSILPLVLSLSTLACTTSNPTPAAPVDDECHDASKAGCVIRSSEQRIQAPDGSSADLDALVTGNTAFATGLYQQLRTEPGNFFYSPHSISSALSMTWHAAR